VPGLGDTQLVWWARRRRRQLRLVARLSAVAMAVGVVGLAFLDWSQRVYPPCARAQAVASTSLRQIASRQHVRLERGEAPATTAAALGVVDDPAHGIRYGITDVVGAGRDGRFVAWAFFDTGEARRGALVIDEQDRLTTVMDACGSLQGRGFMTGGIH
jgi:hypothetical protein